MQVQNLVYDFAIISALMFVAKIVRTKIKFIQKLYIPTPMLAGLFGLFLGKYFLNVLPFSSEISNYAGILIVLLFGSMFLGNKKGTSFSKMFSSAGDTFLVNGALELTQFGLFIFIGTIVLPLVFKDINTGFGLLLPAGFVGGHGTAAAIGAVFAENGFEDAKTIGQTFATFGLLGGIGGGVILINIGARKKQTAVIKDVNSLPNEMLTGLNNINQSGSFGKNTINSMSLDTFTWHFTLVLISAGLAYLINHFLKILFPNLSIPVYGLALICSVFIQLLLKLVKLDDYVDKNIISHIGSTATDYLIAFGIASININVVIKYIAPIVLLTILGFIFVVLWFYIISPQFFRNYWFERGIYIYGMSTGVLATGVILLRIVDPEFKTGVLEDFGFAWIFLSIIDMLLISFSPIFVLNGSGVIYGLILIILAILFLIMCRFIFKKIK